MAKPARQPGKQAKNKPGTKPVPHQYLPRSLEIGNPNIPVRTIIYVEVGDLPAEAAREIIGNVLKDYQTGHPHYCCVLRDGRLAGDYDFEAEFLETVNKLCEIKDDQIVLRNGAHEVDVIRVRI